MIATRGAEPLAAGGYRAVLLLDGDRMVARESLRVGEDCLRWWSDAASLAADDAPVVLVGVGGELATALSAWRQDEYARRELADRRVAAVPPGGARGDAERGAGCGGGRDRGASGRRGGARHDPARGPCPRDRALRLRARRGGRQSGARGDHPPGHDASKARAGSAGARGRVPLPLRARFDDPEPFEE